MRLGKKLQNYRELKGLTLEQLAELTDIPRSTLADYEAGDDGKFANILKISKTLEIPYGALEEDAIVQINHGNENVQNNVQVHINVNINASNNEDAQSILQSLGSLLKK